MHIGPIECVICMQLDVNYETTYKTSYGDTRGVYTVPTVLKHLKCRYHSSSTSITKVLCG